MKRLLWRKLCESLAKIGNGEPYIGFVTSDNELDAVVNTNRSGKYK